MGELMAPSTPGQGQDYLDRTRWVVRGNHSFKVSSCHKSSQCSHNAALVNAKTKISQHKRIIEDTRTTKLILGQISTVQGTAGMQDSRAQVRKAKSEKRMIVGY